MQNMQKPEEKKIVSGLTKYCSGLGDSNGATSSSKRTYTKIIHTCQRYEFSRGQSIGDDLLLTLQFNGHIVSKPINITMIARRAERRQPEYSFASGA